MLAAALLAPVPAAGHNIESEPTISPGDGPVFTPLTVSVESNEPLARLDLYEAPSGIARYGATALASPDANGEFTLSATIDYLPIGGYRVVLTAADGHTFERHYSVVGNLPYGFALSLALRRSAARAGASAGLTYTSHQPHSTGATLRAAIERCRPRGRTAAARRRSCRASSRRWWALRGTVRRASSSNATGGDQALAVTTSIARRALIHGKRTGFRYRARSTEEVRASGARVVYDSQERLLPL